jgi:voltage-gated potassium channel
VGPGEARALLVTLAAVARLLRTMARAIADPATRGIVVLAILVLAGGTVFYVRAEGWSVVDALYFCVVTLTTIGFGDLAPTTDAAKLFTVVYSLVGIGIIAAFVTSLALSVRADERVRPLRSRRPVDPPEHGPPPDG